MTSPHAPFDSASAGDRSAAQSASAPLDAEAPGGSRSHGTGAASGFGTFAPAADSQRSLRPALSFEVMPPRSAHARERLPELISTIESYNPDYVAITSSGTSGWHQGTADFVRDLATSTRLRPLAHLTCMGAPRSELLSWIDHFVDAGVRGFLAIRGDLPAGQHQPPPGYLRYADELVALIREVELRQAARFCAGRLSVGIAAYPSGHPESPHADFDIDVLLAKQRAGADFAITQLFFDASDYGRLVKRAGLAGASLPIIPGIFPITSISRLERMSRLSGLQAPEHLAARLEAAGGADAQREAGLDITAELARSVLEAGAPGLHFYTFNNPRVTAGLLDRLGISPSVWAPRAEPAAAARAAPASNTTSDLPLGLA